MCLYIHIHVYIYIYTCTLYLSYLFVLWLLINSIHKIYLWLVAITIFCCNFFASGLCFSPKWNSANLFLQPFGVGQKISVWKKVISRRSLQGAGKSSILTGFSIINHPFWGTPILETPICCILCSIGIFCLHRNTLRTYIWVQLELEHMMCHLAVDVMLPPVFSMRSGFDLVMIYGHRGMWWSRWEVLVVAFKQKATWHDPSPLSLC